MSSSVKSPAGTIPATHREVAQLEAMTLFERASQDPRYNNPASFIKELSHNCEQAGANYGLARMLVIKAITDDILDQKIDSSLYAETPPQYTQVQRDKIAMRAADYLKNKFETVLPDAITEQAKRSSGISGR